MLDIERLDELPRADLIEIGRRHGIDRPERMTRVELRDELVRVTVADESLRHRTRGWFGVARDLVASVVEAGLHMPDAAKVIRGDEASPDLQVKRPPVATVTLAEIYAAQGHVHRAVKMLDQVLMKEPDHEVAQLLKERLRERVASSARGERTSAPPETPSSRSPFDGVLADRLASASAMPVRPAGEALDEEALDEASEPPESGEVEVQLSAPKSGAHAAGHEPDEAAGPGRAPAPSDSPGSDAGAVVETLRTGEAPEPVQVATGSPEPSELGGDAARAASGGSDAGDGVVDATPAPEPEVVLPTKLPEATVSIGASPGFEHDLLLTVHTAQAKIAYWELAAASVARARAVGPEGHVALRLVSMKPSWDGAECFEHEVEVEGLVGRKALLLPEGSRYPRVAIGWRSRAGFLPLALGVEISVSGEVDFQPPALSEAQVERALERAPSAASAP